MTTPQDVLAEALTTAGHSETAARDLAAGIVPTRYQDDAGNIDQAKLDETVALFGGTRRPRSQFKEQMRRRFGPQATSADEGIGRPVEAGDAGKAEAERRFGKRADS